MPDEGATMQGIECRYIWHLGLIGRRREHDTQYAVVDMSAWPEGEPFGEWFIKWAYNWNIAVAD